MISLKLLSACHTCSRFEPIKTNEDILMCEGRVVSNECTITCENMDKCTALLEHLRKEELKNG